MATWCNQPPDQYHDSDWSGTLKALNKQRGLSLVEMMVYMTLLVLIVGSAMVIMLMANQFFSSTLDNNAVQREAQTTMMRLSRELEESKEGQVLFSGVGEPKGVIFISPRDEYGEYHYDFGGEGLLYWQKWVCYFVKEEGDKQKLIRAERIVPPTTEPTPTTWTTTDFEGETRQEIVSHDLLSFDIAPDPVTLNTFNIEATFGREGKTNRTDGDRVAERVAIENSVHLRN